jgi:hypothetical protein
MPSRAKNWTGRYNSRIIQISNVHNCRTPNQLN